MRQFIILTVLVLLMACNAQNRQNLNESTENREINNKSTKVNHSFQKKIDICILEGEKGWGYDIKVNDKLYIHQPTIPCIQENKGFKTKEEAKKTAELVVKKIQLNKLPPSISMSELDSLGILD